MKREETTWVGWALAAHRHQTRKTLRDVEIETGIPNALLSMLETGRIKNPSLKVCWILADYMRIKIDSLAGRDMTNPKRKPLKYKGRIAMMERF